VKQDHATLMAGTVCFSQYDGLIEWELY